MGTNEQRNLVEALLTELNSQIFVISDEMSRARRGLANIVDKKKIKKRIIQLEKETKEVVDQYCQYSTEFSGEHSL